MLPELGVGNVRKMFPDGVGGAATVSSPKIETIRQLVPFGYSSGCKKLRVVTKALCLRG